VRFTLAGFAPYSRDEVVVAGALTTAVDAALGVEGVAESTTVLGAVPLVDVYSANTRSRSTPPS
jgi:NADPH-dependent glutamate synthase beta subunit-like oxidoreductase